MPRAKKPTLLKAIEGTQRKSRANPNEPVASSIPPVAPEYLSTEAAEKFSQLLVILDEMGLASRDNTDALAMLSATLADVESDTVLLDSVGAYYMPNEDAGVIRPHPAVIRLNNNRQRAQALLSEFGLTPAARAKVTAGKPREENPFRSLG